MHYFLSWPGRVKKKKILRSARPMRGSIMTANIPEIRSATAIGAATFSVDATSIGGANLRGIGGSSRGVESYLL
jgi:hypothetical protein